MAPAARRSLSPAAAPRHSAAAVPLLLAALLALAVLAQPADAHGYLAVPKSRNKIAHERGEYYVSAVVVLEVRGKRGSTKKKE